MTDKTRTREVTTSLLFAFSAPIRGSQIQNSLVWDSKVHLDQTTLHSLRRIQPNCFETLTLSPLLLKFMDIHVKYAWGGNKAS